MLTLEQLKDCQAHKTPVKLFQPRNPRNLMAGQVGIVHDIAEFPPDQEPDSSPLVWVLFQDGYRLTVSPDELRLARLRPGTQLKFQSTFIHTPSIRYSGDDMAHIKNETGKSR